jgi:hypothetical protein
MRSAGQCDDDLLRSCYQPKHGVGITSTSDQLLHMIILSWASPIGSQVGQLELYVFVPALDLTAKFHLMQPWWCGVTQEGMAVPCTYYICVEQLHTLIHDAVRDLIQIHDA